RNLRDDGDEPDLLRDRPAPGEKLSGSSSVACFPRAAARNQNLRALGTCARLFGRSERALEVLLGIGMAVEQRGKPTEIPSVGRRDHEPAEAHHVPSALLRQQLLVELGSPAPLADANDRVGEKGARDSDARRY